MPAGIFRTQTPDGIELLEREAERVNAGMTLGTCGIAAVSFNQLAFRYVRGNFLRQHRNSPGRSRKLVTQQELGHPVASQNRAGS